MVTDERQMRIRGSAVTLCDAAAGRFLLAVREAHEGAPSGCGDYGGQESEESKRKTLQV